MRRREFITLLGGAAATWPFAAHAQQTGMPVIGFLSSGSPRTFAQFLKAFQQGLREQGFIEGDNVAIAYRWAEGHLDELDALATELTRDRVALIAATGGIRSAQAGHVSIPRIRRRWWSDELRPQPHIGVSCSGQLCWPDSQGS
jgi:putative ABC transport system substrate-binding protein